MKWRLICQCILISIAVTQLAHIADVSAEEFVIGVEAIDYKPYYYIENNQYKGFARELFDALAAHTGHTFHYRPLPINRLYQALRAGDVDFKFPDNPNWGSDEKRGLAMHYSAPVVGFTDGVLTKEPHDCSQTSFRSLGYVRGFTPWPYQDRIDEETLEGVEVNSLGSLLKMANAGRIDAAFVNVAVARSLMTQMNMKPDALVFSEHCPHDSSNYLLSTSHHHAFIEVFNEYLSTDKVKALINSYELGVNQ